MCSDTDTDDLPQPFIDRHPRLYVIGCMILIFSLPITMAIVGLIEVLR